jgi:ubiquinone/menaquinone biosynthesis C-methylase UbiE
MSPAMSAIPRGAEFHERIASSWGARYARGGCRRRLELFCAILDRSLTAGQYWLDLGCGSGALTKELIKRGANVVAVDASPAMLAAATESVDATMTSMVQFRQGDAQDLSWAEAGAFDGVLCSSVIEYVDDEDEVLRQIGRVLSHDGLLIASIPPRGSAVRMIQKCLRRFMKPLGVNRYGYLDVSRFEIDPRAAPTWFAKAGMRVERVSPFDPAAPNFVLTLVRPALLVYEARKFESR